MSLNKIKENNINNMKIKTKYKIYKRKTQEIRGNFNDEWKLSAINIVPCISEL